MTPSEAESPLNRRLLLRGGAVLAGAAGATAIAAVLPPAAEATPLLPFILGGLNPETSTTTLTIDGDAGGSSPALALNNAGGPSLFLQPLDPNFAEDLGVGEIANTVEGPLIGLQADGEPYTGFLATDLDLAELQPAPYATLSKRVVDTRKSTLRGNIVDRSSGALDSSFRLKPGAWIEIGLVPSEANVSAVFVNLTATQPASKGYLTLSPAGIPAPDASTLNFTAGMSVANAAFSGVGSAGSTLAIRVTTSALTHVIVDLTGYVWGAGLPAAGQPVAARRALARRRERQRKLVQGFHAGR